MSGLRRRTVLVLVAGRGAYRLAVYGAGFVLIGVWGPDVFARYAAAVGLAGWLFSVLAAGVERAALLRVGGPDGHRLEGMFVGLGVLPFGAALTVWLVLVGLDPGGRPATVAAAAALATGGGLTTVLAGLYRLRGHPFADAAAFLALAAAYVVVVALAGLAGLGVAGLLGVLVATVLAVDLVMIAALRLPGSAVRLTPRPEVRAALRMAVTLCAGEVLALVAIAVLYAELGTQPPRQTSIFYLSTIVSSVLIGMWPYLLRLAQPRITSWVSVDPVTARARLRRLVVLIAVPGALLSAAGVAAVVAVGPAPLLIGLALGGQMLVMAAVTFVAFVVESIDTRTRDASALGAVLGFAVIAGAGALLIPVGGAAGALVALGIGWTARCPLLLLATRPGSAAAAGPALSGPARAVRP